MRVDIIITPDFQRDAKKLIKKYPSLRSDLARLQAELEANPRSGTQLSAHVFKIRLAIKSKGKGKSGGARVVSYVDVLVAEPKTDVYLLTIYDKADFESISEERLKELIQEIEASISDQLDGQD